MTPSEAEKEFEEYWEKIMFPYKTSGELLYGKRCAREGYLEAHSRQQEKIEKADKEFYGHLKLFEKRIHSIVEAIRLPDYAGVDFDDRIEQEIRKLQEKIEKLKEGIGESIKFFDNSYDGPMLPSYEIYTLLQKLLDET